MDSTTCSPATPTSAACAALDAQEALRLHAAESLCTRLFADQAVFQEGCVRSCRDQQTGDGQSCAFEYSRSLHYSPQDPPHHGGFTPAFAGIVIAVLLLAFMLRRRNRNIAL